MCVCSVCMILHVMCLCVTGCLEEHHSDSPVIRAVPHWRQRTGK